MKTKEMILTPTTPLNPPKNTYILEVSVMHGDADKNEDIEFEFKNKEYFIEMYNFYDKAYDLDEAMKEQEAVERLTQAVHGPSDQFLKTLFGIEKDKK